MKQALLNCKDVSLLVGLSRSSIWRLEIEGKFPKRVVLSNRCVRWSTQEVEQWVDARIEGRA